MRKLFYLIILVVMLILTGNAFGCDRYLGEYMGYMREIKDLKQFEQEATTRNEANRIRQERMGVITQARRAHGNYIQCFEGRKNRLRGEQRQQFIQDQKIAVEDSAGSVGLDSNEALNMVFRNVAPWFVK